MSYHHHHHYSLRMMMMDNIIILMFTCIIFISTLATTINIDDNGGSDNGKHNHHDDQRLQFIIEPETIWAIADGRKISFRCQVLPADARIRWLLNGTIITDNDNNNNDNNGGSYGDWIKISENKLSIKLQKTLTNSDSLDMIESQPQRLQNSLNLQGAVFQCLAEWNNQVIVSQPAKLIIAELMPFDDQQQSKQSSITNITAIQGNNIIIPCNLPHSIPIAIAEFEFNQNQTITSNNLNQDRYRILPSGQLLIQNVRQFDSGKYRCIAHNPFLQEKMYSSNFIQLKVLKPKHSTNDQKQLRFLLKPKIQMTVIIGSNITFECVVHGFPVPKITWTKIGGGGNDDHLPRLRSFQSNGILIITTVQKNDEGIYSCTASNSKSTIETNTELKVYEMPEIIQDDYEQFELEPGQNMDLYCESRGQPKPLISWLHNGYFIDSQITNDVFFDQNGSILKIIDANPKLHQGIYQCFATNELGTTYAIKVIQFKSLTNYHHHHNHHHNDDQQVSNSNHHHHRFTDSSHLSENSHQHSNIDSNNNNNNGYSNEHTDFIDNQYRSNDNDDDNDNGDVDHHNPHHHNHNHHHHHHHNNDKNQHQHHPHGKKKPGKSGKDLKLIPPSRPEISKLNDDSVMVRWMVPKTTGLPIQFFKVQYKELGRGDWNTVDVDIPAHIFAYPVCCLNPNSTYRFRIAAVYSNDDNKNGKSSNKFIFRKDPQLKRPTNPPTILNATSISSEEIIVEWEHLNIDQQPVDGFFINYRATDSAGQYLMVTSIGRDSRRQNIQHLKPNTAYEIKMQCFNDAGTSDFSNIYTVKTQQQQSSSKELDPKFDDKSILPPKINNEINDKNDNDDYIFGLIIRPKWLIPPNRDWLAIAIIIITMVLFILACSIICCLRQKSSSSSMNGNNSTGTDGTKLKLESSSSSSTTSNNNNNNHHYFNAINGLIQEQNRRLSTKTSATSNGLTNGNNHHAASGLMMLKSIESQLNHHVNNKNHHSSTNEATTTTDSAMMNNNNNNDLSCSSSSTTTTTQPPPQMPITLSMNRRNSFHRNSLGLLNYSSSQHHLYSSNNDQQQQHNMDNQNHVEQQQQQQQIATIDRKRSLKNSISGSYLDPLSNNTPSPSISSSNNNNNGLINRMNQNHHHSSFTRLNGTLERKRRSRHDLSQTTILNNGNGGSGHFYNSRSNINHNGSTMDMFHSSNNHRQQQYSTGNNQTNNNYFHSHHSNSGNSAGGSNNFVIMQSSC